MVKKELMKITAKHKTTGESADMWYKSIAEAKFHNPDFIEFREERLE